MLFLKVMKLGGKLSIPGFDEVVFGHGLGFLGFRLGGWKTGGRGIGDVPRIARLQQVRRGAPNEDLGHPTAGRNHRWRDAWAVKGWRSIPDGARRMVFRCA